MPPKNQPPKNKKADEKKKQEALKDRTFGLKNKKLRAQIEKNILGGSSTQHQQKKKNEDDDLKDMSKIFKPVAKTSTQQNVSADVDPKSVLCVFFKQGMCTKGNKCKFSHDLSIQQKTAKKNLYVDSRSLPNEEETNENWDEKTLEDVAEKKHGEKDRKRPNQTDIVCKYFLEAVENSKYGWFWECPNGDGCIYRHALPKGYVLKKDRKKMEEQTRLSKISLEEFIEKERSKLLDKELTKVTFDTFITWKKKKMKEKRQQQLQSEREKLASFKSGKQTGLSGKDLFTFNPDFIAEIEENLGREECADDGSVAQYEREPSEDGEIDQIKAFEIGDNTFQAVDAFGHIIEMDDEKDESGPSNVIVFDKELFNDEQLPCSDSSDDEEEENKRNGTNKNDEEQTLSERLNKI
uniref:C3H1-type domain-containing protein n=1 Tax=Meloidogyne incognita TaxID=6306 RepID=A0A914KRK6_MELIC